MRAVGEDSPRIVSESKNCSRDRLDVLRSRVNLLSGEDKLLMTMYLENGNSFRQLARLTGVNEANVARRIRRITRRLLNGRYVMCIRHRDKLTKKEMAIAKDYFLMGLSQKKIAWKRNCSLYRVIKILRRIGELTVTTDEA
jgi:DNA-directed RNA polymerase specialized sigma subunit